MHFITIDENNLINGIFDGGKDTVLRGTDISAPDAIRVPEGAIEISDIQADMVYGCDSTCSMYWDGTDIVPRPLTDRQGKEDFVWRKTRVAILADGRAVIEGLSDTDLDARVAELGG